MENIYILWGLCHALAAIVFIGLGHTMNRIAIKHATARWVVYALVVGSASASLGEFTNDKMVVELGHGIIALAILVFAIWSLWFHEYFNPKTKKKK